MSANAHSELTPQLQRSAEYLAGLRRVEVRPVCLPPALAPTSEQQAYQLQGEVARMLGRRIGGWKASLNSDGAGSSAPVFASDLHTTAARIGSGLIERIGIEPEVAFSLRRDLPALPAGERYGRAQVLEAIDAAHAAIEIVISRFRIYEQAPPLQQLADNLGNGGLVVGPACRDWRNLDLPTLALELSVLPDHGEPCVFSVRGGHPLGDPLRPLVWMANHLCARGLALLAGQIVTTGSWAGLRFPGHGTRVIAQFAGLGRAELNIDSATPAGLRSAR